MISKHLHIFRRSDGQSMVEFALLAPILFVVLFGICEFGYAWMQDNTATSAAREAARVAAVSGSPFNSAAADAVARNTLIAAGINPANIVSITFSGPDAQNRIVVTVQVRYSPLTGGFIPLPNPLILTGQTTMRWES